MAILETKIYSALSGNATVAVKVGSRIYPVVMPQDPTLPAITYQRIASEPVNTLEGYAGLENVHISVMSWATGYLTAKELAEDVHVALNGATAFKALLVSDLDGFDPDVNLYVAAQDYSCWDVTT